MIVIENHIPWWSFWNSALLRHIKCFYKNRTNYVSSADFSNSTVYANEMTTAQLVACSQSHFMTNVTILRSVPYKRSFYSCGFEQMKDVEESLQIRIWKSIQCQLTLSNIFWCYKIEYSPRVLSNLACQHDMGKKCQGHHKI